MQAAREPRPAAGRDRGLRGASLPADRAHRAEAWSRRSATSRRSSCRASSSASRASTARSRRSRSAAAACSLYPLYHPAAALYTPAMLKVLEEDFAPHPGADRPRDAPTRRSRSRAPLPLRGRARRSARASSSVQPRRQRARLSRRHGRTRVLLARGDRAHRRPRWRASSTPGDVVTVSGELGSGKTTFVRGACRALGVDGPVTSPTYTIGHRYRGPRRRVPPRSLPLRGVSPSGVGRPRALLRRRGLLRRVAGGRRGCAAARAVRVRLRPWGGA